MEFLFLYLYADYDQLLFLAYSPLSHHPVISDNILQKVGKLITTSIFKVNDNYCEKQSVNGVCVYIQSAFEQKGAFKM